MTAAPTAPALDTSPVGRAAVAKIEAAEARAWADLYAAAPARWAASVGLETREVGGALVLTWAATGRRYFSRVIGLGVARPASEAAIDEIVAGYRRAGVDLFLLQSLPACRPRAYERWLVERALEPFDRQDRVVRDRGPLPAARVHAGRELSVERVDRRTADEWVGFLEARYALDTGPWLRGLVGRSGWHQYVVREDGAIVAARGMYLGPDRAAWLGMEAPVPGIGTDDYVPDAALCAAIVADGLALGARLFVADIEAPAPDMDTPAYASFAALGFHRPYVRTHHARL